MQGTSVLKGSALLRYGRTRLLEALDGDRTFPCEGRTDNFCSEASFVLLWRKNNTENKQV